MHAYLLGWYGLQWSSGGAGCGTLALLPKVLCVPACPLVGPVCMSLKAAVRSQHLPLLQLGAAVHSFTGKALTASIVHSRQVCRGVR